MAGPVVAEGGPHNRRQPSLQGRPGRVEQAAELVHLGTAPRHALVTFMRMLPYLAPALSRCTRGIISTNQAHVR